MARKMTGSRKRRRHTWILTLVLACPTSGFTTPHRRLPKLYRQYSSKSIDGPVKPNLSLRMTSSNESEASRYRPEWAYKWMPSSVFTMKPVAQASVVLLFYAFHLTVISQHHVVLPFQLIRNQAGHFSSIGLDSVAGAATLAAYSLVRRRQNSFVVAGKSSAEPLPKLISRPQNNSPWKLPAIDRRHRGSTAVAIFLLVKTYFLTGVFSLFWEDTLYTLSALGLPLTTPMYRSLLVLLGHLTWMGAGILLLRFIPRPPRFFGPKNTLEINDDVDTKSPYLWFRSSRQDNFVWWVVGGFFVSCWMFNIADSINQFVFSQEVLNSTPESVVTQLVNPENNDFLASLVGYIAPCISAPWWEEVLYRGFLLAALTNFLGYPAALILQGIVFSAHHQSLLTSIPLAFLGWTWAILYTKSQNLLTVIFVHCLWNSRVFLGSWFGL